MYFFMNLVDNKQETLEPKLFNIFCYCTFKWIIFVVEILEPTYEQNLLRIILDDLVFRLVAIVKHINKLFKKDFKEIYF